MKKIYNIILFLCIVFVYNCSLQTSGINNLDADIDNQQDTNNNNDVIGECEDNDGDNYGVGRNCIGVDCDDHVKSCNVDCTTDVDEDGHRDCDDSCNDKDKDGYGTTFSNGLNECLGSDCDDNAQNCTDDCVTDLDDDRIADCADTCVDVDGDNYGTGESCLGTDCNDNSDDCNIDCNDNNNDNIIDCLQSCDEVDFDGDSYGVGRDCLGPDCDDNNVNAWEKCTTCNDNDNDNYYQECDAYNGINGPDCDDNNVNAWEKCTTCVDNDNDGYYLECDSYNGINGPDCDDNHYQCLTDCIDSDGDGKYNCYDNCYDQDNDGYGDLEGCNLGYNCSGCKKDVNNDLLYDCNDNPSDNLAFEIHPEAVEKCGYAVDFNCDKVVDELSGCPDDTCTINSLELYKEYETDGDGKGIFVQGNYAYLAESNKLYIIDLTNDTIVQNKMDKGLYDIFVSGNYAYLATNDKGLMIVDVSDINNQQLAYNENKNNGREVFVKDNYAYMASDSRGLVIFDVTIPDSTNRLTEFGVTNIKPSSGVFINDSYAYISTNSDPGKFSTVDISNPSLPSVQYTFNFALFAVYNSFIRDNYAYVTNNQGLYILDISDPMNVLTEGTYLPNDSIYYKVFVKGNYAFIVAQLSGLKIINISDTSSPQKETFLLESGVIFNAQDIFVSDDLIFIAQTDVGVSPDIHGLVIYRMICN